MNRRGSSYQSPTAPVFLEGRPRQPTRALSEQMPDDRERRDQQHADDGAAADSRGRFEPEIRFHPILRAIQVSALRRSSVSADED
jgi:hypothetical protein